MIFISSNNELEKSNGFSTAKFFIDFVTKKYVTKAYYYKNTERCYCVKHMIFKKNIGDDYIILWVFTSKEITNLPLLGKTENIKVDNTFKYISPTNFFKNINHLKR